MFILFDRAEEPVVLRFDADFGFVHPQLRQKADVVPVGVRRRGVDSGEGDEEHHAGGDDRDGVADGLSEDREEREGPGDEHRGFGPNRRLVGDRRVELSGSGIHGFGFLVFGFVFITRRCRATFLSLRQVLPGNHSCGNFPHIVLYQK